MKLYHFPLSHNSRRVNAVVAQLGLELETEIIDLLKGGQKSEEFQKLNPNGMLPVLDDNGFVLTESRIIIQYLAQKERKLLPKDEQGKFDVQRWLTWDAAHFGPQLNTFYFEKMLKPMSGGEPDTSAIAAAQERFERFAKVLDTHLAAKDWLVGEEPTVADFGVGASLTYIHAVGISLDAYPHLKAWFGRLSELPGWKKTEPQLPG